MLSKMPIRVLDKGLVARIAAGEVVDRPASVVKELVENSLDAGSSQISVEAKGGGVSLIQITDNGIGIPPLELELAFERYATSKIGNLEDLDQITSLGFRGEALPSIAAVAEVDIVSAAAGETVGAYLNLKDGVIAQRRSQGRPQGTTLTVRNLFRQVPARLKFLKSSVTENSHIANIVSQYALAFPEVKFSLFIDGRRALRTPGNGQLMDSVIAVYGLKVAQNMLEVRGVSAPLPGVSGMAGSLVVSRSSRGYLSFFVNRRWITSRLLIRAVEEAYHGFLMSGRYPIAIINVSLMPQEVDINMHPTKTEVKFQQGHVVFSVVQRAVRQALVEQAPVPKIEVVATTTSSPASGPTLWASVGTGPVPVLPAVPPTPAVSLPVLRVLGQLEGTYIIAEGPDGLYLIDQHAAHERVLFESIKRQRSQQDVDVQGLLEPVTFEVSPKHAEVLGLHCQDLAEFGFLIEPFGERAYLIRAVPALLHGKDWMGMLTELLDSVETKDDWLANVAISLACHGAIRAGQALADGGLWDLVRQLEQTAMPHTCPHGRPTMIHLSSGQLRKEFGRD